MDGLLAIDKPAGPTSHDVVARVRVALREPRVGHTGTLDPLASGVLPLVLGRATRLARFLTASDKCYEAVVQLGVATDTYDSEGAPIGAHHTGPLPSRKAIDEALVGFRGGFLQQPPAFSAKKVGGQRSHALARARTRTAVREPLEPVAPLALLAPVAVTVYALDLIGLAVDRITLRIECSSGFYVRSLAHDLGARLGVGAHLTALRRVWTGDIALAQTVPLDVVESGGIQPAIVPLSGMLLSLPAAVLTSGGVRRSYHGQDIGFGDIVRTVEPAGRAIAGRDTHRWQRLLDEGGDLIGIAEPARTPGLLHPSVVLI